MSDTLPGGEQGWLPDYIFRNGRFESGVALFADREGRITRFSDSPEVIRTARRLSGRALLPGLNNVHSHAFQRTIRGRTEHRTSAGRGSFWTWREAMYHAAGCLTPEDIHDVARMAFLEMVSAGITAVGEFHYLHYTREGSLYSDPNLLASRVISAAQSVGLRIALLRTAYVRAGWRKEPNPGQARFITPEVSDFIEHTDQLRTSVESACPKGAAWVGIAPHSVRAVPLPYLRAAVSYARAKNLKIHMHVSEQPAELEACEAEYGVTPIELLHREGILGPDFTGVHAIHISDREIDHFVESKSHIAACPTTERNLGDGIGPAEKWTAAGVPTCYGSDSNAQIDLLEDAREFEYHVRLKNLQRAVLSADTDSEGLARTLFGHATEAGAHSIGAPGGTLAEGKPADFFTLDLDDLSIAGADQSSLLSHIVFAAEKSALRDVWIGGRPVMQDGIHPLRHEIVERFVALQRRLWS